MSKIKSIIGPYGEHTEVSIRKMGGYTYKGVKGLDGIALYYKSVSRKHRIVYKDSKPFNKHDWI